MRESVGSAWLFGLVGLFILLFSSYLVVSVSYSKGFTAKNAILDILEREEGMTNRGESTNENAGAIQLIDNYLYHANYQSKKVCENGWIGYKGGKGKLPVLTTDASYFCLKKIDVKDSKDDISYYNIEVFFNFSIPVLGQIFTFTVPGQTTSIYYDQYDEGWNY